MEVSLHYCSQNGVNVYRAPYYNRNPNIGHRIDGNLGQSPCIPIRRLVLPESSLQKLLQKAEEQLPTFQLGGIMGIVQYSIVQYIV